MVLALNSFLYVSALGLALAVIPATPTSRRVRVLRRVLLIGGGMLIATAIVLSFMGLWIESALAGSGAVVFVVACIAFALVTVRPAPYGEDGSDEDGGGGQRRPPDAPEPMEPIGGPSGDEWTEFDRARAGWDRERDPLLA